MRHREIGDEPDRPDNRGGPDDALPAGDVGLDEVGQPAQSHRERHGKAKEPDRPGGADMERVFPGSAQRVRIVHPQNPKKPEICW
jgi:hypothetical protein